MQKFKTVDELINQLRPVKPVYCIRKKSIQISSKTFQKKFPGKILYAVKTNPHHEVLKTIHPHPTLSEAIMEATADALGEAIHI